MNVELITDYVTRGISSLTVLGSAVIILFLIGWIFRFNDKGWVRDFWNYVGKNFLWFSFIIAFIATAGSLYYSDIAGYNPCKLCWFQRIFMYPLVLLYGLGLYGKDNHIAKYGLVMSGIGALLAGNHYLSQLGVVETSCDVVGYSASCSDYFTLTFGYITIPMMALVAFGLIMIAAWAGLRKN